jgi:hypothetical protein
MNAKNEFCVLCKFISLVVLRRYDKHNNIKGGELDPLNKELV